MHLTKWKEKQILPSNMQEKILSLHAAGMFQTVTDPYGNFKE